MNASLYSSRSNRPNPLLAAGAAVLVSTLVLSGTLWLFKDAAAAASVMAQHHASARA